MAEPLMIESVPADFRPRADKRYVRAVVMTDAEGKACGMIYQESACGNVWTDIEAEPNERHEG